jgi:hypothetical protein
MRLIEILARRTRGGESIPMAEELSNLSIEQKDVEQAVGDPEGAAEKLPEEEKLQYAAAQQSIVDARCTAETNSGLYQVH